MVDWKSRAKEIASRANDLADKAGKKIAQENGTAKGRASEFVRARSGESAELIKSATEQLLKKGQELLSSFRTDKETEKLQKEQQTLADISRNEQDEYLKALLHFLVPFDPTDQRQLQRIYQILAMMNLEADRRKIFLENLLFSKRSPGNVEFSSMNEALRYSMAKDLLSLGPKSESDRPTPRMERILQHLHLTEDQIGALNQWTNWEDQILAKIGRSDLTVEDKDLPVEAMKKASAVGIPLAALYMSGSVVGFSAAGITSGLATIGGAAGLTALGINPMTAGIAALILGGVAVKKILDATLPTTKRDQKNQLEAGLRIMEARRNRYLAMLGEDTVWFGRKQSDPKTEEQRQRYNRAFTALGDLLDQEASVTLGEAGDSMETDDSNNEI